MKKWVVGSGCFVVLLIGCYMYLKSDNDRKQYEYADALRAEEEQEQEEKELLRKRELVFNRIKLYADSAKEFIRGKGYRDDFCFLVDFSIHSGKKRFLFGAMLMIRSSMRRFVVMAMDEKGIAVLVRK